jgi:putative nucleotidyltransferase with HDIG domain
MRRGITLEDVRGLLEILSADPAVLAAQGGAGRALAAKGTNYVAATSLKPTEGDPSVGSLDRKQVVVVYNKAVGAARALMQKVAMGHVPQAVEVRHVVEGLTEAVLKEKYTILGLTRLKSYDEYLFNHSVNVGILSVALGHALGLDPEVLREVGFGAFLHDIGKVNWPEALYRKPRQLNASEWELVRRHPTDGLKILERMGASQIAKSITLEHHVRVDRDRRGYPVLPGSGEPSFFGRLAAVADGYDAMTSHRAYRQAMEPTRAVALISSLAGTVYDPKLTDAFVKMLGIYPVGTLVRLTTRELAVVLRPQEEPARPVVRLVATADGTPLEDGPEINLMEKHPRTNDYVRGILLAVDPSAKNIDVGRFLKPAA